MNGAQLRAMLWLRWRLTVNQWRRGDQFSAVISIIGLVLGLGLAAFGGLAGILGGAFGLARASPLTSMLVWDGLVAMFLLLWATSIITELQRSEIIDLTRLLHLPVSLKEVFLLNYLASHLSFSLALILPAALGLTIGLLLGRGPLMLLLFPLVLGFFFMITAWTYCLRGWLAALMVNKRRRRAVIVGVSMGFMLLFQIPNLVMNVWSGHESPGASSVRTTEARRAQKKAQVVAALDIAHRYIPFLWLPKGAGALAEGRGWPAAAGAFGMLALGSWGLRRAYCGTLRFYQGGDAGKARPAPKAARPVNADARLLVERTLPFVPEESAALACANFRSLIRAPEVKMALVLNVFIFIMVGVGLVFRSKAAIPAAAKFLVASMAVVVTFIGLIQLLFNQFGFDRDGFRALVLLPAQRKHVLLGKNLSLLPLVSAVFVVFLTVITALARLPVAAVASAMLQFVAAFFVFGVLGNLVSILLPCRIAAGSLKPTKIKASTSLLLMVAQMLFPLAMVPILLPAGLGMLCDHLGWCRPAPVTLLSSVLLAALSAFLYWSTLGPLGRLLQYRERKILQVVTQEIE